MKVAIRVKPGASRDRVGGCYPAPTGDQLIISVSARAVEGQANAAVIALLAKALNCPKREITVVSGTTSRSKIIDIDPGYAEKITQLLAL